MSSHSPRQPEIQSWVFIEKTGVLVLFNHVITVYCEDDVKQINTMYTQNPELF
jgi:hypothetical protein